MSIPDSTWERLRKQYRDAIMADPLRPDHYDPGNCPIDVALKEIKIADGFAYQAMKFR